MLTPIRLNSFTWKPERSDHKYSLKIKFLNLTLCLHNETNELQSNQKNQSRKRVQQ